MPLDEAFFYCKAFEIPLSLNKRHIIKVKPSEYLIFVNDLKKLFFFKWEIILPNVNRDKIRNIQLYECRSTYKGQPSIPSGDCFSNSQKLENCFTPMIVWSYGGNMITILPQDTGYPIGRKDVDYSYVVLEVLYENPNMTKSDQGLGYFDQVTLRVHMTKENEALRPNELGVITLGTESEPLGIMIPPKSDRFEISSYCFNNCVKSVGALRRNNFLAFD